MAQLFLNHSCLPTKPKRHILAKVMMCLIAVGAVTYFVGGWAMGTSLLKSDWVLTDNYQQFHAFNWNKECTARYVDGASTPSFECGGIAEKFVQNKNRHLDGVKASHGKCLWLAKYELNLGYDSTPYPDRTVRAFDACWVAKLFDTGDQKDLPAETKPIYNTGLTAENVRACHQSAP